MSKKVVRFVNGGHVELDYDSFYLKESGVFHFKKNEKIIFTSFKSSILYIERGSSVEYFPPTSTSNNCKEITS